MKMMFWEGKKFEQIHECSPTINKGCRNQGELLVRRHRPRIGCGEEGSGKQIKDLK